MLSDRLAARRGDLDAGGRLAAATVVLSTLALLAGMALRPVVVAPAPGGLCTLALRFGWMSLLGFPAGWVLVPLTAALLMALVGSRVGRREHQPERPQQRSWVLPTVTFVVLYVPFGPLVFGTLPPECFVP